MNEPNLTPSFAGKTVLVTGSQSGIGCATADYFQQHGARVLRVDINGKHQPPWHCAIDLAQPEATNALMHTLSTANIEVDLLAHVAGILSIGPLLDMPLEEWLRLFAVNTHAAFYLCQQLGRQMAARRRGAMVLVGSNCARVPRLQIGAYAASKAASQQMLKCLGLELAEFGVRCNVVAPGSTDTAMQTQLWPQTDGKASAIAGNATQYRLGIPLKKVATARDIAEVIGFLLSEQARHITLETITVDGGATLGCGH